MVENNSVKTCSRYNTRQTSELTARLKMSQTKLKVVVALCKSRGIGCDNQLPWKLKNEMKYFTKITQHTDDANKKNAVVMGRKTWESIPPKFRPLNNRLNIVLTSKPEELKLAVPSNVLVYNNFDKAIEDIEKDANVESIWIVGGSSVYKEAMEHKSIYRLYITEIDADFKCDIFFPEYKTAFKMLEDHGADSVLVPMEKQEEGGYEYYFRIYEKK